MALLEAPFIAIRDLMEAGGQVLWVILVVTAWLWALIIERFLYFRRVMPGLISNRYREWEDRGDHTSWYSRKIREQLISETTIESRRYLKIIQVLLVVLPLLGLLGTVLGMIQVFNVMAVAGTSNARLMAAGVSAATISTMAGLVAALSGLFFSARLQQKANSQVKYLTDLLVTAEER